MKRRALGVEGFTLVEIMIVVTLIGLLATIAIPNWVHARSVSQASACINNLRQIDGAVQQWALENRQAGGASPQSSDVLKYLKNDVTCPAGGTSSTFTDSYQLNGVTNKPTCKIVSSTHVLPADTSN